MTTGVALLVDVKNRAITVSVSVIVSVSVSEMCCISFFFLLKCSRIGLFKGQRIIKRRERQGASIDMACIHVSR